MKLIVYATWLALLLSSSAEPLLATSDNNASEATNDYKVLSSAELTSEIKRNEKALLFSDELPVPFIAKAHHIFLTRSDIFWRLRNQGYPYIAEPTQIHRKAFSLRHFCQQVFKTSAQEQMFRNLIDSRNIKVNGNDYVLTVNEEMIPHLRGTVIRNIHRTKTHDLYIDLTLLNSNNIDSFVDFFATLNDRQTLKRIITNLVKRKKRFVNLKHLVFPRFAKENFNSFSHFSGPNCFHAVLSFNQYGVENDRRINFKIEKKFHFNFINNYEYFYALNKFYEQIAYREADLKFGDIIVLYDKEVSPNGATYQSYKHGSVYLGNGYVYTKGSKSPQHPYVIEQFDEDYQGWEKKIGKVGVKVYRHTNPTKNEILATQQGDNTQGDNTQFDQSQNNNGQGND